jgi:hypothetical protein
VADRVQGHQFLLSDLRHFWLDRSDPDNTASACQLGIGAVSLGVYTTVGGSGQGVDMFNVVKGWARNIQVNNINRDGFFIWQIAQSDISGNYVINAGQLNPGGNDPSAYIWGMSDTVMANNISINSHTGFFGNFPSSGNVIAYNVCLNAYTGDDTLYPCIWDGHSSAADYQLFEGNLTGQALQDQTHGSHLFSTWYRNFFTGWESCANGNCGSFTAKDEQLSALDMLSYNRYDNVIANVLGTPSVSTSGYTYTNPEYFNSGSTGWIYNLASGNASAPPDVAGGPIPVDYGTYTTAYRWANWDVFNGSIQYNSSEVPSGIATFPQSSPTVCTSGSPTTCPASFYYSARPAWWSSSIPFPAIGPDVSSGNIGQCSGTLNTSGKYSGTPATSSSQCGSGNTLNTAWGGHVNAIPAYACFLSSGGVPDGTNAAPTTYDMNACVSAPSSPPNDGISPGVSFQGAVVQ